MAEVFGDERAYTLFCEYTQNQLRLKNLTSNSIPSLNDQFSPSPSSPSSSMISTQSRLLAYDYQLCNESECPFPKGICKDYYKIYDDWNPNFIQENDMISLKSKKQINSSNSIKFKTNQIRRKESQYDDLQFWNNTVHVMDSYGTVCSIPLNQSLCDNMYESQSHSDYLNNCEHFPANAYNIYPNLMYRSDSSHGNWQQWPWSQTASCSMPLALSPSSPLDSGLSSQSITSSPSLDTEPAQFQRLSECGSPIQSVTFRRNQCSCSTTSFTDSNIFPFQMRNDSGRSSPWVKSGTSHLSTLTRTNKVHMSNDVPLFDDVNSSDYLENKRFSMSGVYISPSDKRSIRSSTKTKKIKDTISKKEIEKLKSNDRLSHIQSEHEEPYRVCVSKIEDENLPTERYEYFPHDKNIKQTSNYCYDKGVNNKKYRNNSNLLSLPPNYTATSTQTDDKENCSTPRLIRNNSYQSEKAICELEEMYSKLNLHDYDLLDRAERRDLPTLHQNSRVQNCAKISSLTRSKSDSDFEMLRPTAYCPLKQQSRAPPLRRSGVPDRIADDMAIRKQQKSSLKPFYTTENPATYMLYSSHFTPSFSVSNDILVSNQPDIEYDDLSYRKYFRTNAETMSEPQPPFGIPLKPLPPQSIFSDYLHVIPSGIPPPLCHPRGNPDLVRDDLAYRTLRKDDYERAVHDSYSLFYRKLQ